MNSKYKYLAKNTLLFFIASFVPKVLSFVMVPLYTRCLSTSDYGTADLLTNTAQLLMPVLTLQIQDAVLRFAMDRNYNKSSVFGIALRITNMGFLLLLIGIFYTWMHGLYGFHVSLPLGSAGGSASLETVY